MEEELKNQEQPQEGEVQGEPATTPQTSALEERLNKLESDLKEQRSYITKLEQENATYRQILADRGQTQQPVSQPSFSTAGIDAEIAELERQAREGLITADELAIKSLQLIKKAKEESKVEAVKEVTNLYTKEQEIQKEFATIFEDPELKGKEKILGDIASGYLQAGIAYGMDIKKAVQYAKDQTKAKLEAFKAVAGVKTQETNPSLKGEGESVTKPKEEEKPLSPEESQASFIEMRRKKLSMR